MKKVFLSLFVIGLLAGCKKSNIEDIISGNTTGVNIYPKSREFYNQSSKLTHREDYLFTGGNLSKVTPFDIDSLKVEKISGWWDFEYERDGKIKKVSAFQQDAKNIQTISFFYKNGKISEIIKWNDVGAIYGDTVSFSYDGNNELRYYVGKSFGYDPNTLGGDVHLDSVVVSKTQTSSGFEFVLKPYHYNFTTNSYPDSIRTDKLTFNNTDHSFEYFINNVTTFCKTSKIKWMIAQMEYIRVDGGSTDSNGGYIDLFKTLRPEMEIWDEIPLHFYSPNSFDIDEEILSDPYGRVVQVTYFQTYNGKRTVSSIQKYIY